MSTGEVARSEAHAIAAGKAIQLVPVEIFGLDCDHDAHRGEPVPFAYGLCDAVPAWSDCNRAIRRIFRVEDLPGPRAPEDTIMVWASTEDLAKLNKEWGDGYADAPPTDLRTRLENAERRCDRLANEVDAECARLEDELDRALEVVKAAEAWVDACVDKGDLRVEDVRRLVAAVDAWRQTKGET